MKRHRALVSLSHDHHHALVQARRLARSAAGDEAVRLEAAGDFLAFYASDTIPHFREEEELLFPLVVDRGGDADELLARVLLEHQRIHALAERLREAQAGGRADAGVMQELGELLNAHVRLEERELFPLIEEVASDRLPEPRAARRPGQPRAESPVVDLVGPSGTGPLWGTQTDDLNATLLAWPPGGGPAQHVNNERDVLFVVVAGEANVRLDGADLHVRAGQALVVEKGRTRSISAGPDGVRYVAIHLRRGPLQIRPARPAAQP